jgi:hypothetical protein
MAKLTAKQRKAEPSSDFGLPAQKKYPMPDKAHAANAKARAAQQVGKTITPTQKAQIDAKANRIGHFGAVKGKRGS